MSIPNRKHSQKDVSVPREDSSPSRHVEERCSGDSHDSSGSEVMDDQSPQTPSTGEPPADDASPQIQSSCGSQQDSSGSARQSSPEEPTNDDRATPIAENQTASSITKSHSERDSSSVEGVDQEATELPRPAQSRGRDRRGRGGAGRRGRGGGGLRPWRGRGRHAPANNFSHLDDDSSLLDEVLNDPSSMTDIVDQWIRKYTADRETAMRMLTQFFVSSCGSSLNVTSDMRASMDHNGVIRLMTENLNNDNPDYPLAAIGSSKQFREIYSEFVSTLVRRCQHSVIYDQYLMDKTIQLLTCLTDSQIRAFRHTATFAVMKLTTALVDVVAALSTNLANARRQYESERRKARSNRSNTRLENLEANITEFEEHMQESREMLDYIFKSVFVRRYIDVVTDVRSICFAEIGLWINKYPEIFFDDDYLQYIGRGLWDEADEVRLKCLETLRPLYETEDLDPKFELFTARFKDRIVAMTLDRDFGAAAEAVRLATCILKHRRDILTDSDFENIYLLVYSADREVAHAAGEFVNEVFTVDDSAAVVRMKSGKPRSPNTPIIRDLVTFFIESEYPDHAVFLVDSLIETSAMMKDWECMTDLLLEEAGPDEEALDDKQESCLVEIMACCTKQAATGEPPVGREPARKNVSVKRQEQIDADKRRLTVHFVSKLPLLLVKYKEDLKKIVHLLKLPRYFDLEIYGTSSQKDNLDDLMEQIYVIVTTTRDTDVLKTSAKTLASMCAVIPEQCENACVVLLDYIVESYLEVNERHTARTDESATPDDDETIELVHSLRTVAVYYSLYDMNSYGLWNDLWKSLEEVKFSSGRLPDEAVTCCIKACYFSILWSQKRLIKAEVTGSYAMREARQLTERLHSFVDLMAFFVGGDANASTVPSPTIVREDAYRSICDFLVYFNGTMLAYENPVLHQLVYQPDDNLQKILKRFVLDNVFCDEPDDNLDDDSKVELMLKRRNFLACYCKLVMYHAVPITSAVDIFKNYVKHYENYGDIIKETICRARDNNRINCARAMLRTLWISHDEILESRDEVDRNSEEFKGVKTLAKKFARLLSFNPTKNSESLLALHGDGVVLAITPRDDTDSDPRRAPRNLPFLEILVELLGKLSVDDRVKVLEYVENKFEGRLPLPRGEDWNPLYLYVSNLSHEAADQVSITGRLRQSHSRTGHAPGEEGVDEADKESVKGAVAKPIRKKGSRKPSLPVTKVKHPRGAQTYGLANRKNTTTMSDYQISAIDDPSQDVHREAESGLESLQRDSQSRHSSHALFEDIME